MNLGGSGVRVNPIGVALLVFVGIVFLYYTFAGGSVAGGGSSKYERYVSMKKLLAVSIEMAKRGGAEVKRIRQQADIGESSKGKTREGANDPRTDGDMRAHVQMFYGLKKRFPNLNIISEEHDEKEVDTSKVPMADLNDPEVRELLGEED